MIYQVRRTSPQWAVAMLGGIAAAAAIAGLAAVVGFTLALVIAGAFG